MEFLEYGIETFAEWRQANPERWARLEGNLSSNEHRILKFLDAQIHLTRHQQNGVELLLTPEVKWLIACITIFKAVIKTGSYPADSVSVSWVKNQRRGSLCEYQVAALTQIPDWKWAPRRTVWNERAHQLDEFRKSFGREPRVRSGWKEERSLAHWASRQRQALREGKLSPAKEAALRGEFSVPTSELTFRLSNLGGSYADWFKAFWVDVSLDIEGRQASKSAQAQVIFAAKPSIPPKKQL